MRHEVADLIVTPERESNRAFRRTYLTAACVTGNGGVRSLRDNVASASAGHQSVNRGDDGQSQGGRELIPIWGQGIGVRGQRNPIFSII